MKIGLVLFFIILINIVSAIRINEVMPNPDDSCNDCTEWIELYSETPINLENYTINATNKKINFSFSIQDYLIITKNKTAFLLLFGGYENKVFEWPGMSLLNSGEGIFLFDNSLSLISSINFPSFSSHANKSYSLLSNSSWIICNQASPGKLNLCETQVNLTNNTIINQTITNTTAGIDATISLSEIKNGDEANITINFFNLENKIYDLKIFIEDESNKTISEVYDNSSKKWLAGTYYLTSVLSWQGNISLNLRVRIKNSFRDFSGDAITHLRLRESNKTSIIFDKPFNIKVNEADKEIKQNVIEEVKNLSSELKNVSTENIIKLNSNEDKEELITYKSRNEIIKENLLIGFCIFLILIIVILLVRR